MRRYSTSLASLLAILAFGCNSILPLETEESAAKKTAESPRSPSHTPFTLTGAGLSVPESAIHDPVADVYYVSNINGDPFGTDGKGFISRVAPDGQLLDLKWIDGASEDVRLDAPKGLAIVDRVLWVADVHALRRFDLKSGLPIGSLEIPGTSFLNDLTVGAGGVVYASDTGLGPGFEPTGTDAIYAIGSDGALTILARGPDALSQPNGLLAVPDGVLVVTWKSGALLRIAKDGSIETLATLPEAQLDGIVAESEGSYLVSSWAGKCVFRVDDAGESSVAYGELESPADLGYDAKRGFLLVPWFNAGRLDALAN